MLSRADGDVLLSHGRRARRPFFLFLVRYHGTILAAIISSLLLLTTWNYSPRWTSFSIASYWLLKLVRRAIVQREFLRRSYRSAPVQFGIAFGLVIAISVFLAPFYHLGGFLPPTGEDTLWLLYVLPVAVAAQIGFFRIVLSFTLLCGLALHLTMHPFASALALETLHDTTVKTLWIFLFSFIMFTLLRIVGERSANLRILHTICGDNASLRRNPEMQDAIHSVTVATARDFEYGHVAVYLLRPDQSLGLVATNSRDPLRDPAAAEVRLLPGNSIPMHVVRTGEAYTVNDINEPTVTRAPAIEPRFEATRLFPGAVGELAVPIKVNGRVVGILDIRDTRRDRFLDQDREACELLAAYLSNLVDNAGLLRSRQQIARITASITQRFFSRDQLGHVLSDIARAAHEELHADVVMLYEHEPLTGAVRFGARSGELLYPEGVDSTMNRRPSLVEDILVSGRSALFDHDVVDAPANSFASREQIRSRAVIALQYDQKTLGLMFLNYRYLHSFDSEEREACSMFARFAALAIHREQARERELTQQRKEFVASLHDEIAQTVKGVHFMVEALIRRPESQGVLATLRLVADGLEEIKSAMIRIAKIQENVADDPIAKLMMLADEWTRVYGTPVVLSRFDSDLVFAPRVFTQIRFIVQEAVVNAAASGASKIDISVTDVDGVSHVLVRDDGCGFDPETVKRGKGLSIMAERAIWIRGTLVISSEPECGTHVELLVPCDVCERSAARN